MTDDEKAREDKWKEDRWFYMVRYVARLSKADQIKWSLKQSEATKAKMRESLRQLASH
jgi:hypothetical protein